MKKIFTAILSVLSVAAIAQTSLNQVIVLNEGYYDWGANNQVVPVSIGSYDPALHVYNQFATMPNAHYASDVLVDGNFIYAACSDGIYKYDKVSKAAAGFVAVTGVRKMEVWNNQLLITRGDVGLANNYFQVYDKSNLSFVYELDNVTGPQFTAEGIVVIGDSAYIAINNAFNFPNYTGLIGVIHLPTQVYVREFSLGAIGINPDYMTSDNGKIYTLNNRDYTNASVSIYDLATGTVSTTDLNITGGCSSSQFANDAVYYQVSGNVDLMRFDVTTQTTVATLPVNQSIYGMAFDKVNNLMYAGNTDYFAYGKVYVFDLNATLLDSFNVSVSPGSIAMDYNYATGTTEVNSEAAISVFPNPSNGIVNIEMKNKTGNCSIKLFDAYGKLVFEDQQIEAGKSTFDFSSLSKGIYPLQVECNGKTHIEKIVIQ